MPEIIVVHGAPGAGKSTHSKRLAQLTLNERPVFHVSAGDRLRDIRTGNVGSVYSSVVNSPDAPLLLDHKIVNGIIFEFVSLCPNNSVVLIDGYPRFPEATKIFLDWVKAKDYRFLGCINLNISLKTSVERLTGRGVRNGERIIDITQEFVEGRYSQHLYYTNQAVKILGESAPLINLDAESDINLVWKDYNEAFRKLAHLESYG